MVIKKGTSPKKRSVAPKRKTTTSKKIPPKSKNMSQTLAEEVCASPEIKKHKSVTMEVLQKLRLYFSLGFSDEKACYYAKISTSTLYNYQKKFPDFLEEKTMLKESLTDQAKINIAKEIK